MTLKKVKKTRLTTLTKCLIGNYHNGFNNEHAKHVLEKTLVVQFRCWERYQLPLSKQRERKGILQASLYMYPSQI